MGLAAHILPKPLKEPPHAARKPMLESEQHLLTIRIKTSVGALILLVWVAGLGWVMWQASEAVSSFEPHPAAAYADV